MKRDQIEALKHNAKLDVRLPDQLRDEFLARCREEGVSSGAVIRSLIIDYVFARRAPWRLRLKEIVLGRKKWFAAGVGSAATAALAGFALIFPPLAAAESEIALAYRVVVENDTGTIWRAVGRVDALEDSFQTIEFPNDDITIEVRLRDCAEASLDICSDDTVYVELNVEAGEAVADGAQARANSRMVLMIGQSGGLDTTLGDNLSLDVVLTPMD